MRKCSACFLCHLLFVLFVLGGCTAGPSAASAENGNLGDGRLFAEPEYIAQWPENAYTACISEPKNGTIDYVCSYTDSGWYEIVMKDISKNESAAYVEELIRQGYTEIAGESNEVSAGILLQKEGVKLSVAYSNGGLNILIAKDSAA